MQESGETGDVKLFKDVVKDAAEQAAGAAVFGGVSKVGTLAETLGGIEVIPRGTKLALGLSERGMLEAFAEARGAVSVNTAYDLGYVRTRLNDPSTFKAVFKEIAETFVKNKGSLEFNLTGLKPGIKGFTTDELEVILGSKSLTRATKFYRDGVQLTGRALKEALTPWLKK